MPSVVTTAPRGFFHAEIPFEVAVCTMGLMGPLLPKSFFLVLTYDVAGRLPAQLLSSRMLSACNVLLGYAHIGEEMNSMSTIRSWLRDHVGPCILEADGMPPVNWVIGEACRTKYTQNPSENDILFPSLDFHVQ
jgi:hypothetical protein